MTVDQTVERKGVCACVCMCACACVRVHASVYIQYTCMYWRVLDACGQVCMIGVTAGPKLRVTL